MQHEPFNESEAKGRWFDILAQLGIPERFLTKKNGPCPLCGGKDRFRWSNMDDNGTYFCSGCGPGGGAQLAMKFKGMSFIEFKDAVRPILGTAKVRETKKADEAELRRQRRDLWLSGNSITESDPVGIYLTSRLGHPIESSELRCVLTDDGATMLARVQSENGKRVETLHRTFLTQEGKKIDGVARKMMPGAVNKGGAVRLMPPVDGAVGVAEGVETALSAHILFGVPVWAVLGDSFLRAWNPPAEVSKVIIFADNDAGHAGQAAAHECARRCFSTGKSVEVRIPDGIGSDWNDVLRQLNDSK